MDCFIYTAPVGVSAGWETHYIGYVSSDGNVYNAAGGAGAGRNHIVGYVASDGNVYDVPYGTSAGWNHIVGHVDSQGNVYDVPYGTNAGWNHCIGHVDDLGNVYRVPAGVSAGRNHIVGRVEGDDPFKGAAALLLLNFQNQQATVYPSRSSSSGHVPIGIWIVLLAVLVFILWNIVKYMKNLLIAVVIVGIWALRGWDIGKMVRRKILKRKRK